VATVMFWILAPASVAAGAWVFRFDSMARATFALLGSFLAVGGLLILLDLAYLGVAVILMMIMEMVIMAVFMIAYMMNPAGLMPMQMVHNKRGSAVIATGTFLALTTAVLVIRWPSRAGERPKDPTRQLGEALMGTAMLPMTTLGFALFATMVATVVLATDRGRYDRFGDNLDRPRPDDPTPGGVGR
jgi:NADH:ubiquinone oxidoreductase subunit 6 (subunit J)